VRTKRPSMSLRLGSDFLSFNKKSNSIVPSAEAENTTARHVNLRGLRKTSASRFLGEHLVSVVTVGCAERLDIDDTCLGEHLRPALLGEVEIVHVERVLRAMAASHHATAAALARGAVGTFAAKESRDRER
jgi:hypothetical protein